MSGEGFVVNISCVLGESVEWIWALGLDHFYDPGHVFFFSELVFWGGVSGDSMSDWNLISSILKLLQLPQLCYNLLLRSMDHYYAMTTVSVRWSEIGKEPVSVVDPQIVYSLPWV